MSDAGLGSGTNPCHCSQAQSGDKTRSVASFVAEFEWWSEVGSRDTR